jgi:hypothetical protein
MLLMKLNVQEKVVWIYNVTKYKLYMKRRYCIIQPGHIGDVIVCLPIAKKLADEGGDVVWPLWSHILPNFTKGNFPYVKFVEIKYGNEWYQAVLDSCVRENVIPIDLCFNQPGTWEGINTKKFKEQTELPFDAFRYQLAGENFKEKWNFSINRNAQREDYIYNKVCGKTKYIITHFEGTGGFRKEVKIENPSNHDVIEIKPYTDCVFDWIKVIERAECLILVDSCFANLVEQMNLDNKKLFIKRRDFLQTPVLKNDWKIIE